MTFKHVLSVADQIYKAETPQGVFDIYLAYAQTHGVETLFFGRIGFLLTTPQGSPEFYITNTHEWAAEYLRQGYVHVDPVVLLALRINRAFRYEEAHQDLTPVQENLIKTANAAGLVDGFVVPIHNRVGSPGAVSMAAPQPLTLSQTDELRLEMLAHIAFRTIERLLGLNDAVEPFKLTDRERTVLTLVARGKTNWEIGAILSISEYSVRDYLKALSERLETVNRTHSVARAMQLGLISP